MGAWNMKIVMECLKEADVTIADWKPRKYGSGRIRRLDTYDLALLLAIAYRQKDPEYDENCDEYVCYGGEELLSRITRMGTTKLEDCRDFLVAKKLITYDRSAPCPKYLRYKVKKDTLDYVWRLNLSALLSLMNQDGDVNETPPRGVAEPATRGDRTRHAGIKKTNNKKTKNSSMSGAAADDLREANNERAKLYISYIRRKYRLANDDDVGINGIIAGTANKKPDDVKRIIDEYGQTEMLDRGKFGKWIGGLINTLKNLKASDDPSKLPSVKDLEEQFGPGKRLLALPF